MPQPEQAVDCWNLTGVWGDQSCPELKDYLHCHNCPVFARSGRQLFSAKGSPDYLEEWAQTLAEEPAQAEEQENKILVFRVGPEWLGLPLQQFREIHAVRSPHRIPHRSSSVLLGLVNIRGGLELCVSLAALLNIASDPPGHDASHPQATARLLVLEEGLHLWVFPVDEVLGVRNSGGATLEALPVTVSRSPQVFTRGLLTLGGKKVGLLDEGLLFHHLRKQMAQ